MRDGWIIEKEGVLALWSDKEIRNIQGIPALSDDSSSPCSLGMGKVCLAAVPSDGKYGVYASNNGIEWALLSAPPEQVVEDTFFYLDTHSGVVSYIQDRELSIVDRSGKSAIELPSSGLSCAALTKSGDWLVVGKDVDEPSDSWNRKTVVWILRKGAVDWKVFTPTVSPFQDFLIRNWYATDRLSGMDVWEFPRIFVGDSGSWDEWSYDSIFVESESGLYRPFRTRVGVICGFGRDTHAVPFYTTTRGEYMTWNGKRFIASGWRTKLSKLFSDVPGDMGFTSTSIVDNRVRGVLEKESLAEGRQTLAFASDDFGKSWYRPEFGPGNEGWKMRSPFVRP